MILIKRDKKVTKDLHSALVRVFTNQTNLTQLCFVRTRTTGEEDRLGDRHHVYVVVVNGSVVAIHGHRTHV